MTSVVPQESYAVFYARAMKDVFVFCHLIQFEPHSEQRKVLRMVQQMVDQGDPPKRALVKAGTGVGKTAIVAVLALWLLLRTGPGTRVMCTAVTEKQITDVFMHELTTLIQRSPEMFSGLFQIEKTRIYVRGYSGTTADAKRHNVQGGAQVWDISALVASGEVSAQGRHAKHLIIIAEEVSSIDEKVLQSFLQTLTSAGNIFLGIGNPNFRSGQLYRAFHGESELWPFKTTMDKLQVSLERPDLVHPSIIEDIRDRFGEEHDQWRVKVKGDFPLGGDSSVMDLGDLDAAKVADSRAALAINPHVIRISMDIARKGRDNTVIGVRVGNSLVHLERLEGVTNVIAASDRALEIEKALGFDKEHILYLLDAVGVGGGPADYLTLKHDRIVYEFGANRVSPDVQYKNMETMAWFNLRDMLADRSQGVFLGGDQEMYDQLSQRDYDYIEDHHNTLEVESKKKYLSRVGGGSPDTADAVVMLWYDGAGDLGTGEVWVPGEGFQTEQQAATDAVLSEANSIVHNPYPMRRGLVHGSGGFGGGGLFGLR